MSRQGYVLLKLFIHKYQKLIKPLFKDMSHLLLEILWKYKERLAF